MPTPTLYASNNGSNVYVIDPVAKTITKTITGFTASSKVEAFPNALQVWECEPVTASVHVNEIDAVANTLVGPIASTALHSVDTAFSPDSSIGYVLSRPNSTTWEVQSIDTTTQLQIATVTGSTAQAPFFLLISPDGSTLYALLSGPGTGGGGIAVIDTASMTLTTTTTTPTIAGNGINAFAINTAGTIIYCTTTLTSGSSTGTHVIFFSTSSNSFTGTSISLASVSSVLNQIAVSPDDTFGYVCGSAVGSGVVTKLFKLDLVGNTVIGAATGLTAVLLEGLVITADNLTVFVCDRTGNLIDYLDCTTNAFTGSITCTTPFYICLTTNPAPTFQIVMVI